MKRITNKIGIFAALLILSCGLIFAFGCEKKNPPVEGLSSEQVETIRKTYFKETFGVDRRDEYGDDIDRTFITKYYGTYNGNIAFCLDDDNLVELLWVNTSDVRVDGIFVGYSGKHNMTKIYLNPEKTYDHKQVLEIEEAYEKGYITRDQLLDISEKVKAHYKELGINVPNE